MSKVLKTVNGEMLMNTFLPPIEFAVENLIPQGLHILSGSPKIGKSWMALMLCLKVAKGEKLWNFETSKALHCIFALKTVLQESKADCLT